MEIIAFVCLKGSTCFINGLVLCVMLLMLMCVSGRLWNSIAYNLTRCISFFHGSIKKASFYCVQCWPWRQLKNKEVKSPCISCWIQMDFIIPLCIVHINYPFLFFHYKLSHHFCYKVMRAFHKSLTLYYFYEILN